MDNNQSELKQAMREKKGVPVISPSKKPYRIRPQGFNPNDDHRIWNYDHKRGILTRVNLDNL